MIKINPLIKVLKNNNRTFFTGVPSVLFQRNCISIAIGH